MAIVKIGDKVLCFDQILSSAHTGRVVQRYGVRP